MYDIAALAAWLAAGLLLGTVYFWLVGRSVGAIIGSGASTAAAAYFVLRLALVAVVFAFAASRGALPLLAALLGFLGARTVAIRTAGG